MNLNKEKVVFLVCLLTFVGTAYFSLMTLGEVSSEKPDFPVTAAGDSVHVGGGPDDWEWFKVAGKGTRRDPFATVSKWSGANPDPMPLPPRRALARRVPLPGMLAASGVARPPLELHPPESAGEEEEPEEERR